MLFEIPEEVKEYVSAKKEYLKPIVILNMVRDVIEEMLAYNIPKKAILEDINRELGTDINYYTFVSFVRKLDSANFQRRKTNKFNTGGSVKSNNFNSKQDSAKNGAGFNPFKALEGLQS